MSLGLRNPKSEIESMTMAKWREEYYLAKTFICMAKWREEYLARSYGGTLTADSTKSSVHVNVWPCRQPPTS